MIKTFKGKQKWNEKMYSSFSTGRLYEHKNPLVRFIENQRIKKILELVEIKPEDRLIEVGCEEGYLLRNFLGAKEVVGLDIAKNALEDARKNVKSNKVKFVCADATQIPFPDRAFDKVICSETLEHVKNPSAILKELNRIVANNGLIIISVPFEKALVNIKRFLSKLRLFNFFLPGIENKKSAWHLQEFDKKEIVNLCSRFLVVKKATLVPFPLLGPRIVLMCKKSL